MHRGVEQTSGQSPFCPAADPQSAKAAVTRINRSEHAGRSVECADWMRSDDYAVLRHADRCAFAWEWLRRSTPYRTAWDSVQKDEALSAKQPRQFGLERFEDPALAVPAARPLWCAAQDPSVIRAVVLDPFDRPADRIDLWRLLPLVSVTIDSDDIEHLLLSDGVHSLRIDIVEGTLIGNPSSLHYGLYGIAALHGPLPALQRLVRVVERAGFEGLPTVPASRRERWILELRVADALLAGAGQQDIARGLFGNSIADARWRAQNPSYRQRVLRLVKAARANLASPLDRRWFAEPADPISGRATSPSPSRQTVALNRAGFAGGSNS